MKKINRFNVIFVGIVMSILCIVDAYLLCVDALNWYDLTGLKEKFHTNTLAELHPLHTMWGFGISIVYIVCIALLILGIMFISKLSKSRLWIHS